MTRPSNRNPAGMAMDIYTSESWRINGGRTATAYAEAVPLNETDGFDVSLWSEISVKFYGDDNSYAGVALEVRVWRWYSTAPEGYDASAPVGRWVAEKEITVAVDPALVTAANKQDWTFPTLHADKMYMQIIGYADGAGLSWLYIQPYGHIKRDATQTMSSASSASATIPMATHNAAVIEEGIHPMDEAKTFDGAALPNAVAEGDAVRAAATLRGVRYVMPVDKDGSDTPVVLHDAIINAANGGTATFMAGVEGKNFDGAALPNAVAEGDAARIAATLNGVLYNMVVTEDGSDTPVLLHSDPITTAAGEDAVMMAGAEARATQATAVTAVDATRLMANVYGEIVPAYFIWATQAGRVEEDDPLDTRDVGDELNLSNLSAAQHDYYFSMEHYKYTTIQLDFAAALGVGVTVWVSAQDDGTAPAACFYTDVTNSWFGAASFNADTILEKDTVTQVRWLRIRFDNTGGAGTEDVDAYVRRCW